MMLTIIATMGYGACFLKGLETVMTAPVKVGSHIWKFHSAKKFARWKDEKSEFLDDFAHLLIDEHLVKLGYEFTTSEAIDNSGLAYRFYLLDRDGFVVDIELTIDAKLYRNNVVFNYETEDEHIKKFLDGYFR